MRKLIYFIPVLAVLLLVISFLPENSKTEIKDINFKNFENKTALDLKSKSTAKQHSI